MQNPGQFSAQDNIVPIPRLRSQSIIPAEMKPSDALRQHRDAICATVRRHRVANPRVFGSTALARDHEGSDLDLLVDPLPQTTLFDLGALQVELEELLGCALTFAFRVICR